MHPSKLPVIVVQSLRLFERVELSAGLVVVEAVVWVVGVPVCTVDESVAGIEAGLAGTTGASRIVPDDCVVSVGGK